MIHKSHTQPCHCNDLVTTVIVRRIWLCVRACSYRAWPPGGVIVQRSGKPTGKRGVIKTADERKCAGERVSHTNAWYPSLISKVDYKIITSINIKMAKKWIISGLTFSMSNLDCMLHNWVDGAEELNKTVFSDYVLIMTPVREVRNQLVASPLGRWSAVGAG